MNLEIKNFKFEGKVKMLSLIFTIIGITSLLVSFSINKTVGWVDYSVFAIFFTMVAVSGIFFMCVSGVLQASWVTPFKRIPEAMTRFLPVGMLLMLGLYFGLHTIYEWTHTDMVMNDPILVQKIAWLNEPGFMFRMVLIFVLWMGIAKWMRSYSEKMDDGDGIALSHKLVGPSAISLIIFGLSISVAAFDWIMSTEPHWFSTIFGIYIFAGSFVSGIAFVTLAVIVLRSLGYFKGVINENHLHDLGKWLFAMSVFWAYIWVSQYILIWYANIPEETEYFVLRHDHWNGLFFLNLGINFFFPFLMLISRAAKRSTKRLVFVSIVLLCGHYLDMYLMMAPKVFHHHHAHITGGGVLQILQLAGGLGLFVFIVGTALSKKNLVSKNDPTLEEGIHLHQ